MKKLIIFIFIYGLSADIYLTKDNIFLEKSVKSWVEFKNDKLVRQHYDYSCGSASLATLLKYYYREEGISEQGIIEEILKSKGYAMSENEVLKDGDNVISFSDLSAYARGKGFKAIGLAIDFETLSKLQLPAIIYVNIRDIGHFSVYKGVDNTYVYLADPSFGNIKIRLDKFKSMFYQRQDSKYPGKILIFLSQDKNLNIDKDFMDISKQKGLKVDDRLKQNLIYQFKNF